MHGHIEPFCFITYTHICTLALVHWFQTIFGMALKLAGLRLKGHTYIRTYVHMTVVTKVVDAISMKVHFQFNRCTHDKTDY